MAVHSITMYLNIEHQIFFHMNYNGELWFSISEMEICRSPLKTVFGTEFKADNTVKMSRLSSDSCAPLYVFDFCWKASIIFLLLLPPPAKPAPTHCSSTRTLVRHTYCDSVCGWCQSGVVVRHRPAKKPIFKGPNLAKIIVLSGSCAKIKPCSSRGQ